MKKIIVNEQVLKCILAEIAKGELNEISSADAYTRFYEGKVPIDVYNNIMNGTNKMTPFHKLALDLAAKAVKKSNEENLGEETRILRASKFIGDAWAGASQDARQLMLLYLDEKRFDDYTLYNFTTKILQIASKKNFTENGYSQAGYKVLYENDRAIITCTTSYAASKKYYGDSKWCTASDVFGRYNGFLMFGNYTDNACLIQFVSKVDRAVTYQAAVNYDLEPTTICTFEDYQVNESSLNQWIKAYIGSESNYDSVIKQFDIDSLISETEENYEDEKDYWMFKITQKKKSMQEKLNADYRNGAYGDAFNEALSRTIGLIKEGYENDDFVSRDSSLRADYCVGKSKKIFYLHVVYYVKASKDMREWAEENGINMQETYLFKLNRRRDMIVRAKNAFPLPEVNCVILRNDDTGLCNVYNFSTGELILNNLYFIRYFTDYGGLFVKDLETKDKLRNLGLTNVPTILFDFIKGEIVCDNALVTDKWAHRYYDGNERVEKRFEPNESESQ